MKKIITIIITLVLGLGFSAAAFAVEGEGEDLLLIQNVETVENNDTVLDEGLEEEVAEEEAEEEEEEEGESFWNQNTIVIFLVAFVAIVVILNLMQLR